MSKNRKHDDEIYDLEHTSHFMRQKSETNEKIVDSSDSTNEDLSRRRPPFGPPSGRPQRPPFGPTPGPEGPPFGPPQGQQIPPMGPMPGPGQEARPPGRPPRYTPRQPATVFAVDPGAIRRCTYQFVYIWLENGRQFWAYLIYVGRRSIAGFRWTGFNWVYFGTDLRNIESFVCI